MAKILIVDDEAVLRDALKAVLPPLGHEVSIAADSRTGLELLRARRPDLVILDRAFSQLLEMIKAESPRTAAIVLTGFFDPQMVEKYHKMGAKHFLSKKMGIDILVNVISRALAGAPGSPAPAASPGGILVVDDDPTIRLVLKRYLELRGYRVETAEGGRQALELARSWRPKLVLLDVGLPEMDGLEVLKRLRQEHPQLAVMMITGSEDLALAQECVRLGAGDYMMKPINFEYLELSVSAKIMLLE